MVDSSSSEPAAGPSLARTGLRASGAFAASAAMGGVLAVVLGGGAFVYFLVRIHRLTLTLPLWAVAIGLAFVIPAYVFLGLNEGRVRAFQKLVAAHGESVAARIGAAIAEQIEARPAARGALAKVSDWISVETLHRRLAPLLGDNRFSRGLIRRLVDRLPLADLLQRWRPAGAADGVPAVVGDGGGESLRQLLTERVHDVLTALSTPSRTPLWILMALHAAIFAAGLWMTR